MYAKLHERLPGIRNNLAPTSARAVLSRFIRFTTFVERRTGGFVLADVRQELLDDYLTHLRKADRRAPPQISHVIDIVFDLYRYSAFLTGGGLVFSPVSQIFSVDETEVFSKVVNLAEKAGKHVELMVVAGANPYAAIIQTAERIQTSRIVMGLSPKMTPAEQGATVGREWENLPEPRPSLSLEILAPGEEESIFFNLGPHPPRLWPEDLDLLHRLWLDLSAKGLGSKLHHRDIVGVALRRMQEELGSSQAEDVLADVKREVSNGSAKPPVGERRT